MGFVTRSRVDGHHHLVDRLAVDPVVVGSAGLLAPAVCAYEPFDVLADLLPPSVVELALSGHPHVTLHCENIVDDRP
jgi:predicted LPLAT superfamily acyltransferase